jgi:hypothetical protein
MATKISSIGMATATAIITFFLPLGELDGIGFVPPDLAFKNIY